MKKVKKKECEILVGYKDACAGGVIEIFIEEEKNLKHQKKPIYM